MPTLGEIVREKVADGRLSVREPVKTWAGYGRGQPCSACELPILAAQAEYEFEEGGATYRFHVGCYGLWEGERRRRGRGGTTRDESP